MSNKGQERIGCLIWPFPKSIILACESPVPLPVLARPSRIDRDAQPRTQEVAGSDPLEKPQSVRKAEGTIPRNIFLWKTT